MIILNILLKIVNVILIGVITLFGIMLAFFHLVEAHHFKQLSEFFRSKGRIKKLIQLVFFVKKFKYIIGNTPRRTRWIGYLSFAFVTLLLLISAYSISISKYHSYFSLHVILYALTLFVLVNVMIYFTSVIGLSIILKILDTISGMALNTVATFCFITPLMIIVFGLIPGIFQYKWLLILLIFTLFISHIKLLQGLIITSNNAKYLELSINRRNNNYSKYIVAFMWLFLLLFTLYSEVLLESILNGNSFVSNGTNVTSPFPLLIFTITTFFTTDFGDYSFQGWGTLQSLIIVISSILFVVIFLAGVVSKEPTSKFLIKKSRFRFKQLSNNYYSQKVVKNKTKKLRNLRRKKQFSRIGINLNQSRDTLNI